MPKNGLPPDSTIVSVKEKLHNPDTYVRGVLEALLARDGKKARVRIGVSGTGQYPCYQIIYPITLHDDKASDCSPGERYNDNHTLFSNKTVSEIKWSKASMSLKQVWRLFGEIRGWTAHHA
jgi:hypothetical protein